MTLGTHNGEVVLTFGKPDEITPEYFREAVKGFILYQLHHVSDFYEGLEELFRAAHKFGDVELLTKISSGNLKIEDFPSLAKDVISDEVVVDNESTILRGFDASNAERIHVHVPTEECDYMRSFWLNVPCSLKECKHYCNNSESMNCSLSDDYEMSSVESIAYQLDTSIEEIEEIIQSAGEKIGLSALKTDYLTPLYDVVRLDGFCDCCNSPQDDVEDYDESHRFCSSCVENFSEKGARLVARFKRPLKEILVATSRYHRNSTYQAAALGVTTRQLQNLFYRVNISKVVKGISDANAYLYNKRPGRAIRVEHEEYLNMHLISTLAYQDPTPKILDRLKSHHSDLAAMGVQYTSATSYL